MLAAKRKWHAPFAHPTCWTQTRAKADKTLRYDLHVMLWRVSEHLGISVKRAHHVTHVLGYKEIATLWVPKGWKRRAEGNSREYLMGKICCSVKDRRGFESLCERVRVLLFAI